MLRSSAYCVLSLSARRVLDRLEIELADHGGTDNGKLPVTYDDFQQYGIHRQAIYPAIREVVALGFVEITEEGVAGAAEYRKPNLFRLTYRNSHGVQGDGTHEWKRVADDDAEQIAAAARLERPSQKHTLKYGSCQKSVRKPYRKRQILSTETTTTPHSTETTTTIDISSVTQAQQARGARPSKGAVATGLAGSEVLSRVDILQSRIATKLGNDGWLILQSIKPADLENLTALEARGELDGQKLGRLLQELRRGAA